MNRIAALAWTAALAWGLSPGPAHAAPTDAEASAAAAPQPPAADAPPPRIAAAAFAERPAFWNAQLSPDGTTLSFIRHANAQTQFVITNLDSGKVVRAFYADPSNELDWYRWVGNDKLLLAVSTPGTFMDEEVRYTRLILIEIATGTMTRLFARSNVVEGDNVIHVAEDGSHILVAMQKTIYDYPAVLRHELDGKARITTVQEPREGVWDWTADDTGVVRMGTGWQNGRQLVYYRAGPGQELKLVARFKDGDESEKYWDALQIIGGSNEGYVLSAGENGRVGLRRFDFAKRQPIATIFEHPDWDIDSVSLRDGKPVAAFYTADRDEVHWFDPKLAGRDRAMRKALGTGEVWVVSRAQEDRRMLVYAGNESDPGVLYLYDPAAARMEEISQYRPSIDIRALAAPRPVQYTARDGTTIRAYLTLPRGREAKGLPLIVMPHGGPYGIRDKLEYNDEVQLLANRGYAVLQPNFRGSGGYGAEFFALGEGQIGRAMQDDIDDGMDWAVKEGIADPARVCVVGGSYGGYAALWAVLRNPERYACAASWAGVTDWNRMLRYDRRYLTERVNKWWSARVRGDQAADLDAVSAYRLAGQLARPVLLAHGTKDKRVPISQYNMFEKAARAAPVKPQTLVIKDEGHSFSSPESARAWFEALEGFLAKHNPADAAPATPVTAAAAPAAPASAMP